jgi:hypothetical protein
MSKTLLLALCPRISSIAIDRKYCNSVYLLVGCVHGLDWGCRLDHNPCNGNLSPLMRAKGHRE